MGIFADNAPRHWAAGLPVIPLMIGEKRPAVNAWQTYADSFPDDDTRESWLQNYSENNIGLPLGPCADLVAIDIDVLEPEVQDIIEKLLPTSPWVRVGKKGSVRLYRYNGHRTARIRKSDGSMVVEILSKGSQIAIPPSIHPDTGRPYSANMDLVEALRLIPDLPRNIEDQLRTALEAAGVKLSSKGSASVTKWVPAGARDNAMVAHAGLLSRGILRGERSLLEALAEIEEWVNSFVERVSGDDIDPEKAKSRVIEFLLRDVKGGRALPVGWDNGLTDEDKVQLGIEVRDEDEIWDFTRIRDYVHTQFTTHTPGSAARIAAMSYALARIAANKEISKLEEETLLRYISQTSGNEVSVATLRSQLKDERTNGIKGNDHTQIAEALLEELGKTGEVKHFGGWFWQWRGSHWEKMDKVSILGTVATEFGDLPGAKRHSDHKGIVDTAATLARVDSLSEEEATGINFANGFLTDEFEFIEHKPELGMTYVLPYRYLPELAGHCPMFHQLLHDIWGNDGDFEDKIQALREAIAATMFQVSTRYSRAICLLGVAHSGKSTIMEIVSGLMPEDAKCAVPPTVWGEKFEPVAMVGKLLNMCGELSESKFIDGDKFKAIVEGSRTSVQFKGKDSFEIYPQCAHWFATNHMPRTRDTSGGFTRRWLILEFTHPIPAEKKIERYHEYILAEEIEAIAAWAVEGLKDLYRTHDYTLPTSTLAALDDMANANNTVRTFLKSCSKIERKQGHKTREYDLYMEYRVFCAGVLGVQASQMKTFSSRMKELQREFGFRRDLVVENNVDVVEYVGLQINKKVR